MTPQKRNADAVSPAGSSTESPHKRARSDSGADTTHDQNGVRSTANGDPDLVPDPSSKSHTTLDNDDQAALLTDLPRTWDEASDMDKLLMRMKEGSKASWINFGRQWERATGEKPAEGELQSRYKHLKNIKAQSSDLVGRQTEHEPLEELLNHSDDNTTLKTRKARRSSYAKSRPSDESSRAISQDSKALRVDAASISEDIFGHDLPESWEQANAGDQLIMRMKTSRKSWAVIEKAWQDLTGMTPVEGAVQERYRSLRGLVIPPRSKSAITKTHSVKAPDQAIAKSTQKAPKKRKSEVKISEEVSGESSSELSDQDSEDFAEDTATMACRKPRNGIKETAKTSSATKSSDQRTAKRTKLTHAEPSDAEVEAGWSSDEVLESSLAGSKSAQSSRTKSGMTVDSGTQNTAETAEEMLVEMKERGCSWTEIIQAWAEQTGTTYAEGTLRNRYTSIKKRMGIELSKTSASNKRKSGATCQDGDENESCRKRSKTMAETPHATETPVKQNTDRGKRKSGVKYAESTTDEDELFATPAKPTKPAVAASSVKRGANRAVKVDRSDPEWLVTNEKSPLTSEDLHAEFSNPKTYEQFTKSDWEDLRETLPPNVPLNPDGYSIPMTFFKYDPDFRRGIREFQEDLAAGRLDPKWQAEAAEAMEARARGDFDAYKEEQFEAFWGQKQKMPHGALAGESTKIKLDLLIENEIFKVGDSFSYTRVFGRGKSGILIEKDCKVGKVPDPLSNVIADFIRS